MKKNNTTKIALGAGILVLIAFLVGWFILNPSTSDEKVNDTKTTETPIANSESTPSASVAPAVPYDQYIKDKDKVTGAKEVAFFSKEDVEEVLAIAQRNATSTLSNRYFLSGKWVEEEIPMAQLNNLVGSYYDAPIREKILGFKVGTPASDILPFVFYVGENNEIAPSPLCAMLDPEKVKEDSQISACPVENVKISDLEFAPVTQTDGQHALNVKFTANAKIPVTIKSGNTAGTTDVTYTYNLNFIDNPNYDKDTNPNKFVISNYETKTIAKKVEAIK